MNSDDSNSLLDAHGKPIQKPRSDREALEALIRSELNDAKEKLRESNTEGLKEIADKFYKPKISFWHKTNVVTLAALAAVMLFGWLAVPGIIRTKTEAYIRENLVGTSLTNTVDDIIAEKADALIENQLKPLALNVDSLQNKIVELNLDISNKQAQLVSDQAAIRTQIQPLFGEVSSLQQSISVATEQEKKLQDEQKLMALMNRGEVFDRDAIQQLEVLAQGTNETAPLAQAMLNKVQRTLLIDRGSVSYVTMIEQFGEQKYNGPFTSDEIGYSLFTSSGPVMDGTVNLIGNPKQSLFVPKLVELAHSSGDLWTINRIANALKNVAGVDFFPWDLKPLDQWWDQNQMDYTNWPFEQYASAFTAFQLGNYPAALANFESVLAIDPTADKSRALAVGCAIELGDMNKAEQLNTNFSLPDGRWKQWAEGKIMLETNVEEGTSNFVQLLTKYPTLASSGFIRQGNGVVREMDWPLYLRLMSTNNQAINKTQ